MPVASTSLVAYKSLDLSELLERVYLAIEASGTVGMTNDELVEVTGIAYRTLTPRIAQLEALGLVYRAGDTRPGLSGRQQKITRAKSFIAAVPKLAPPKGRKNPFVEGVKFAAKIVLSQSDLTGAKKALRDELIKLAAR